MRDWGAHRERGEEVATKHLVVCSDGTWNAADRRHPTNVVKLSRAILPADAAGAAQPLLYDPGVGTGNLPDRLLGGVLGLGLSRNVEDGYRFLVQNYEPGDRVYLFGFSRGAYTVRSLAGLLRNAGVLRREHADRVAEAMRLYRGPEHPDSPAAQRFRAEHAHEVGCAFLGVWDTVGALGIPGRWLNAIGRRRHEFHDVTLSRSVESAFHALAIDERRRSFTPTLWERQSHPEQRVEQVWFAGAHSDVGGGYGDSSLADLALLWLAERAVECGLAIDLDGLRRVTRPAYDGRLHDSRSSIFRLLPSSIRAIGERSAESVHESVRQRRADPSQRYAPPNLEAYLASIEGA